jgi:hypothetical protein
MSCSIALIFADPCFSATQADPSSKKRALEGFNAVVPQKTVGILNPPSKPDSLDKTLAPFSSKSATTNVSITQNHRSSEETGAEPRKPDQDVAFLRAVATKKRGKKNEDQFDREFNNLRISKPDVEEEEREQDYDILADFGDDSGMRGNFMVVVEIDVLRSHGRSGASRIATRPEWAGRPDYKKFKKVWFFHLTIHHLI